MSRELAVAACNYRGSDLQSCRSLAQIKCDYKGRRAQIKCDWAHVLLQRARNHRFGLTLNANENPVRPKSSTLGW